MTTLLHIAMSSIIFVNLFTIHCTIYIILFNSINIKKAFMPLNPFLRKKIGCKALQLLYTM